MGAAWDSGLPLPLVFAGLVPRDDGVPSATGLQAVFRGGRMAREWWETYHQRQHWINAHPCAPDPNLGRQDIPSSVAYETGTKKDAGSFSLPGGRVMVCPRAGCSHL